MLIILFFFEFIEFIGTPNDPQMMGSEFPLFIFYEKVFRIFGAGVVRESFGPMIFGSIEDSPDPVRQALNYFAQLPSSDVISSMAQPPKSGRTGMMLNEE